MILPYLITVLFCSFSGTTATLILSKFITYRQLSSDKANQLEINDDLGHNSWAIRKIVGTWPSIEFIIGPDLI